jgi:hypothetical protein
LSCIIFEYCALEAKVYLKGVAGIAPQSLAFSTDQPFGMARLRYYLAMLDLHAIELFDYLVVHEQIMAILNELTTRIHVLLGDLRWLDSNGTAFFETCISHSANRDCRSCLATTHPRLPSAFEFIQRRADAIIPLDRMASAFAGAYLRSASVDAPPIAIRRAVGRPHPRGKVLGVLSPLQSGETDAFLVALGRCLIRLELDVMIVTLGRCIDDLAVMASGNVFVAGEINAEEYLRTIAQYEIAWLVSPIRTGYFWLIDEMSSAAQLPKAYFDWSYGAFLRDTSDLALDPRVCDQRAALQIASWITGRSVEDFAQ